MTIIRNPNCLAEHQKPVLGECICIDTSSECKDMDTLGDIPDDTPNITIR